MSKATLITVREAASYRGITERQVQRLANAGLFPIADVGPRKSYLFKKSEIRYAPVSLKG